MYSIMIDLLQNSIISIVTALVALIILAFVLRQVFLLKGEIKKQSGHYREIFKLVQNNDGLKLKPIRKCIRMEIKNCQELFKQQEFNVKSHSLDVLGFNWYLEACTDKKGFFSLYLHTKPPGDFNGQHRIEADYCLSILNALHSKDLIESVEHIYENITGTKTGCGIPEFAKLEDLLDPTKGFLRPHGAIEVEADFTIKSSTLDHLF